MKLHQVVTTLLTASVATLALAQAPPDPKLDPAFIAGVDLTKFRLVAVQHEGRFKTFDTLARSVVQHITGNSEYERIHPGGQGTVRQEAAFTYLDLLFNGEAYNNLRLIYIKKKPIRDALTQAALDCVDKNTLNAILKDGRVSLSFLAIPEVNAKLSDLSRDVMRTAKEVEALMDIAELSNPLSLARLLRVIPPPQATSQQERWYSIEDLTMAGLPQDSVHAGVTARALAGVSPETQQSLTAQWSALGQAWKRSDAAAVNAALDTLAAQLPQMNPQVYPPVSKLGLEHWYFQYNKMMWTWAFYLIALILLLMSVVYRWRGARRAGIAFFALAFALHTTACGIRWYLAGRIPNSNMFEAVTAAAWLGAALAIFLELGPMLLNRRSAWWIATGATVAGFGVWFTLLAVRGIPYAAWKQWGPAPIAAMIVGAVGIAGLISLATARRTAAVRGLPLLGASAAGMVALMSGQFLKNSLDSDIGGTMPVLSDLWLYIHTNMIIASYALIGMAFVTAAMYVVGRMLAASPRKAPALWLSMALPTVLMPLATLLPSVEFKTITAAWSPFVIVFGMYALANVARLLWRTGAARARAAWTGSGLAAVGRADAPALALAGGSEAYIAAAIPLGHGGGATGPRSRSESLAATQPNESLGKVLDGATMLLLELSFITLWTGIIMGAIWADHSWGRPWGWDPKEVFALNTWIIFLILVHVRLKVIDKALWTAVLAVIGTAVMLFNWVVVNFFIVGLHSYA